MNYATVISMSTQTTNILKEMYSNKKFYEMWDKLIKMAKENDIEPAKLPRKKQITMKLEGNVCQPQEMHIKDYY